jgi:hypothetical protein
MSKRKTLPVIFLLEKVNAMLASKDRMSQDQKQGACLALESVLFEAGVYNGFSYLESAGVENACTGYVSVKNEYDRKYHPHSSISR